MKTESPESDLGLTTRSERNAIPLLENLYGGGGRLTRHLTDAEDLIQDTIGECRAPEQRLTRHPNRINTGALWGAAIALFPEGTDDAGHG